MTPSDQREDNDVSVGCKMFYLDSGNDKINK